MLPVVAALSVLVASFAAAPADAAETLPEGCSVDAGTYRCEWTHEAGGSVATQPQEWAFPTFARTLATITILLDGTDNGWQFAAYRATGDTNRSYAGGGQHVSEGPTGGVHVESSTLLLERSSVESFTLWFNSRWFAVSNYRPSVTEAGVSSRGTFRVTYVGEPVAEGTRPERPAATRDDPQLADARSDARADFLDIEAVWLDDALVGDGLFETHVGLVGLGPLDFSLVDAPTGLGPRQFRWFVSFVVQEEAYTIGVYARESEEGTLGASWSALLLHEEGSVAEIVMQPRIAVDAANATLSVAIPETSVGSPGPGTLFESLSATSGSYDNVQTSQVTEDVAQTRRYPFALGGPDVWDELNPRLAVAATPWYEDPLAAENLPNTLQVLGAIAASATFLAGLVVVRRHRAVTRRLVCEVENAARSNSSSAREGLLALGRVQETVAALFHKGSITEGQYQIVTQRIALEATQLALRRDLGLDDGAPGESAERLVTR